MCKVIANSGLRFFWVSIAVIFLDRVTKYLIQKTLVLYASIPVTSFFHITLVYNKGAAFSFLNSASGWQTWIFGGISAVVSLIIIIVLHFLSRHQRWMSIALALILGGALGNLWDRISYGHVIDFLDFFISTWHWPVFNIADSAICIGTVMLILDAIHKK